MEKSAGLAIVCNDRLLLIKNYYNGWDDPNLSIPKGKIENGETALQAAKREVEEEVGLAISNSQIDLDSKNVIKYNNKHDKIYKKVWYWFVYIDSIEELGLQNNELPEDMLQPTEVSWAGFVKKEKAKEQIFHRYEPILEQI